MEYAFNIRKAVPEDAYAIWEIMQESFKKYAEYTGITGTLEALQESVQDIENDILKSEVFIATIDKVAVGNVRVKLMPDGSGYISRFGVKPAYNNIGIGKALMNLVDKYLRSMNVKEAYLYTASNYKDLVRFYYGRGFYIDSVSKERGYPRAKMVKCYRTVS
jgi:ribosomal protein S18 acetylase RimI-like enzyme